MRLPILITLLFCLHQAGAQTGAGCSTDLYINAYHYPDGNMIFNDHAVAPNGDVVIVGTLRDPVEVSDAIIMKTTANGALVWAKTFRQPGGQEFLHVIPSRDGNFLVLGLFSTSTTEGVILMKIDPDGNILWQKAHTTDPIYLTFGWFREDADGNLYVSGHINEDNLSFQDRVTLLSFDRIGGLRFAKFYRPPDRLNIITSREMVVDGEFVYICGNAYDLDNNLPTGLLIKARREDGLQVWSKTYAFNNGGADFNHISVFGDSLRLTGYDKLNTSDTSIILVCDKEGQVGRGRYLSYAPSRVFGVAHQDPDGSLIYSNNYFVGSLSICKVDLDRGVQWFRAYDQSPGSNWMPRSLHAVPGGYLLTGRLTIGSDMGLLARFSEDGRAGCDPKDIAVSFGSGSFTMTNNNYPAIPLAINPSPVTVTLVPYDLLSLRQQCRIVQTCTSLQLTGPDKACAGDTVRFVTTRNAECHQAVRFQVDTALFRQLAQRDDTTWFLVKNGGRTSIKAFLGTDCTTVTDTLSMTLSPTQGLPDLGGARNLCNGEPLTLDAGSGFTSYRWQDGSTGRTLRVTTAGNYRVRVTDASGCAFADSVTVSIAPPPSGFLPPTATVCVNGQTTIRPTTPFAAYLWNTGSREPQLTVNRPGTYWLEVDDGGCIGRDTTHVTATDCTEGFHVPNAFTPDDNGLNDRFHPIVRGNLAAFHFTVFNRYGEKVFDTSDPAAGWDGRHKGDKMPIGTYVWFCRYQFEGKQRETAKGTVMLVR